LAWLSKALDARFADQETLENDTDIDSLRADPRFADLTGITRGLATQPASTREEGWRWDLDFYVRRMKQMHWDLYAKVPQATMRKELDSLKGSVGSLSDGQIRAQLKRITALVGDGHTSSRLYPEGESRMALPIHMFAFKEGLYIIGADKAHEDLLGAKVVKVGDLDVTSAMEATRAYASVDNDMGYLSQGPGLLVNPIILQSIGAAKDETGLDFTVEKPGASPAAVHLEPMSFPAGGHGGVFVPAFTYLHELKNHTPPLYLRERAEPL